MTMILPLNEKEGFNVKVEPAPKGQCKYTFYKNKTEIKRILGRQPIELNTNTAVWKQIQECIDPNDNFKKDKASSSRMIFPSSEISIQA